MMLTGLLVAALMAKEGTPKRVVCIGDSVTAKYAPVLMRLLSSQGIEVRSFTEVGTVPSNIETEKALAERPDFILVGLGTDAATEQNWSRLRNSYVPGIEELIERLRSGASHPKVFLCMPPPSALPDSDPRTARLANEVLPLLRQVARETDCPIVDFDSALRNRLDLVDELMPNSLGIEVLADAVADVISTGRKANWRVVHVDSEEIDEGPAKNAIDGDPDSYWHTNYSTTDDSFPHEIQVDTGMVQAIGGFSYVPRQDGVNGRVAKYEFYVSIDGKEWGPAVASGTFPRTAEPSKIYLSSPANGRYFKFRALSEQQGQKWASVGELDILKFYPRRR